ncbi:MAG: DUF1003 domain-containing protein [Streptomyces sp.]|uniref:DUF1003 domain-containing protein n=1 Tax=Streptomyces sp. TaxID=1931 RepID=UPI0025DDCEC6|nr:DUF1003 domain-containing protein [Streptomyces sp.]MBW8793210.1 DUF1003 domain-containing protein [Streptomyces sp.]
MTVRSEGRASRPGSASGGTERLGLRARHERLVFARLRTSQDRFADAITAFAGTMGFVYVHAVWFAVWIALNLRLFGAAAVFDPYPFGLLTMIVSLEAIFLSTFVMVSQNRQAARENVRADLDFETNLRAEIWAVHTGKALGLNPQEIELHVQEIIRQSRSALESGSDVPPVAPDSL